MTATESSLSYPGPLTDLIRKTNYVFVFFGEMKYNIKYLLPRRAI